MLIYSIQPASLYEQLAVEGVLTADPNFELDTPGDDSFRRSYRWMVQQMRTRGIKGVQHNYPFWGWAYYGQQARPDLRHERRAHPQVMLTLEVSPLEVLLSDYELWHSVLNNNYVSRTEKDSCHSWSREAIEESWEDIFGLYQGQDGTYNIKGFDPDWWGSLFKRQVQATFWELKLNQVIKVTPIRPSKGTES